MRTSGNTMLITGGGSGIGRALAHRFDAIGNHVIVAGRNPDALNETIAGRSRMSALALDVADPASIAAAVDRLAAHHPALNVLVNNAGVMRSETLNGARDLGDAVATIATNLLGPIRLTDALVDHLAGRRGAAIVNVSSGLAFVPLSTAPTYSATKAAIRSYTQALRAQLAGRVEVIELIPPAVQTDLTPGQATRDGYMPLDAFMDEVMMLFAVQPTPAEIRVGRLAYLADAEREGRYAETFAALNAG